MNLNLDLNDNVEISKLTKKLYRKHLFKLLSTVNSTNKLNFHIFLKKNLQVIYVYLINKWREQAKLIINQSDNTQIT